MTQFLRLLTKDDKAQALLETCTRLRVGESDPRHFEVAPDAFLGFFGRPGREVERPELVDCFFRPGLTWPPIQYARGASARRRRCGCALL